MLSECCGLSPHLSQTFVEDSVLKETPVLIRMGSSISSLV